MSNRFFGEYGATIDGKRYTLRCDFNALIAYEDETGEDAMETFEALEEGRVGLKQMRLIMWALLQHHHPDTTPSEAGVILSKNIDLLQKVVAAASPDPQEGSDAGNVPKPQKKKANKA